MLDTHTFLWGLSDSNELSGIARDWLRRPDATKLLSLASVWEMAIKCGLGKLRLPMSLEQSIRLARGAGTTLVSLELAHILRVEHLPTHHRDPFDRMLIAQSFCLDVPILSRDETFDRYGVTRIW